MASTEEPQLPENVNEGSLHVLELFGFTYTVLAFKRQLIQWLRTAERANEQLQVTRLFSTSLGAEVPVFKKDALDRALNDTDYAARVLADHLDPWKTSPDSADKSRPFLILHPQNKDVVTDLDRLHNACQALESEMSSCTALRANSTRRKPVNLLPNLTVPPVVDVVKESQTQKSPDSLLSILPPLEPEKLLHYRRTTRLKKRNRVNSIPEEQTTSDSSHLSQSGSPQSTSPEILYELSATVLSPPGSRRHSSFSRLSTLPELEGDDGHLFHEKSFHNDQERQENPIIPGIRHLNHVNGSSEGPGTNVAQGGTDSLEESIRHSDTNAEVSNQPGPSTAANRLVASTSISDISSASKSNSNIQPNIDSTLDMNSNVVVSRLGDYARASTISNSSVDPALSPPQERQIVTDGNTVPESSRASPGIHSRQPSATMLSKSPVNIHTAPAPGPIMTQFENSINSQVPAPSTAQSLAPRPNHEHSGSIPSRMSQAVSSQSYPPPSVQPHSKVSQRLPPNLKISKSFTIDSPILLESPPSFSPEHNDSSGPSNTVNSTEPETERTQQIPYTTAPRSRYSHLLPTGQNNVNHERANSLPTTIPGTGVFEEKVRPVSQQLPSSKPVHETLQQRHTFPSQAQTAMTLQQLQHQQARPMALGPHPQPRALNSTPPRQLKPPYPVTPLQTPSRLSSTKLPTLQLDFDMLRDRDTHQSVQKNPTIYTPLSIVPTNHVYRAYSPPEASAMLLSGQSRSAPPIEPYRQFSISQAQLENLNGSTPPLQSNPLSNQTPLSPGASAPIPTGVAEIVRIQPAITAQASLVGLHDQGRQTHEQAPNSVTNQYSIPASNLNVTDPHRRYTLPPTTGIPPTPPPKTLNHPTPSGSSQLQPQHDRRLSSQIPPQNSYNQYQHGNQHQLEHQMQPPPPPQPQSQSQYQPQTRHQPQQPKSSSSSPPISSPPTHQSPTPSTQPSISSTSPKPNVPNTSIQPSLRNSINPSTPIPSRSPNPHSTPMGGSSNVPTTNNATTAYARNNNNNIRNHSPMPTPAPAPHGNPQNHIPRYDGLGIAGGPSSKAQHRVSVSSGSAVSAPSASGSGPGSVAAVGVRSGPGPGAAPAPAPAPAPPAAKGMARRRRGWLLAQIEKAGAL